jgi:hypothetical protein
VQLRSVIELRSEVAFISCALGDERVWVCGTPGAMLVDRATVRDEGQPADRVDDLLPFQHGRV